MLRLAHNRKTPPLWTQIFNPMRYPDPLTSDRGATLRRIMQADKEALEVLLREPATPRGVA
jgi:hypothetical protein